MNVGDAGSVRHVLALGLTAGYIDALGFVDLHGVYTAAMTGNTVKFGVALVLGDWLHLALVGATLASFFLGALIGSYTRRRLPHPVLLLLVVIGLLASAQVLRTLSGGPVMAELPLLAMAMAMQGETISRFGATAIQTIVVTNNLVKLADGIVGRYLNPTAERAPLAEVVLPACAWLSYASGAIGGVAASQSLPLAPFVPPIVVLVVVCGDLIASTSRGRGR